MSVIAPTKPTQEQSKVHISQYIKTENEDKTEEGTKPAESESPDKPETN